MGAAAGIIAGGLIFGIFTAYPNDVWPAEILGLLANLVVYVIVSLFTQSIDQPKELFVRADGKPIPVTEKLGLLNPFDKEKLKASDDSTSAAG